MASRPTPTPEETRRQRATQWLWTGSKMVLLGPVFLFVLDNPSRWVTVPIGILIELGAVACFVHARRLRRGPLPPPAVRPAEPYAALQASLARERNRRAPAAENEPRSPVTPR